MHIHLTARDDDAPLACPFCDYAFDLHGPDGSCPPPEGIGGIEAARRHEAHEAARAAEEPPYRIEECRDSAGVIVGYLVVRADGVWRMAWPGFARRDWAEQSAAWLNARAAAARGPVIAPADDAVEPYEEGMMEIAPEDEPATLDRISHEVRALAISLARLAALEAVAAAARSLHLNHRVEQQIMTTSALDGWHLREALRRLDAVEQQEES